MPLEVQVLGVMECRCDGTEVILGGPRQRTLFAALVAAGGATLTADRLAELIWGDDQPENPARSLSTLVSRLRKALADVGGDEVIERTARGIRLRPDDVAVDAHRFEQLVVVASKSSPAQSVPTLREALDLWRGDPYEEFADLELAIEDASRLTEMRLGALEQLGVGLLDSGRAADAVPVLDSAVSEAPLRERALMLLMRALYAAGRHSDALDAYQRYRVRIGEELGLEPSREAQALEGQILGHDPALAGAAEPTQDPAPTTLAFLVSELVDADGSWERDRAAMDAAIAAVDSSVRDAVGRLNGRVFAAGGATLSAVFDTAADAARAAVLIQEQIMDGSAPQPNEPRVRMGLHVGVALQREGSYYGAAVNRAGRLTGIAEGGQVLVSAPAAALIDDADADDIELVDVGRVALRDLARPERVFQIGTSHPRPGLPAPAWSVGPPGNLPHDPPQLFGREADLADVSDRLERGRLVTLVGTGGIGKTSLALAVARASADRFPDGVWICDLSTTIDAATVGDAILAALGVVRAPDRSPAGLVAERVRHARMLVVLDNCEQVREPVGDICRALLTSCPDLRILATSREVIGVTGEQTHELAPLDHAAAAELVEHRLADHRSGAPLSEPETVAVAELCRRLDGLPLALELVAARARSVSPADIVDRLDWALGEPSAGSRAWVDRHRTLTAAVQWSYELLDDDEALAFDLASVFVGGFSLPAIEALLAAFGVSERDAVTLMESLVSKSMVRMDDTATGGRYSMLEPLRRYASERLSERGLTDRATRQHMTLVASQAQQMRDLTGSEQLRAMAMFEADLDNFRAALDTAVRLGDARAAIEIATVEDNKRQLTSRHLSWSEVALGIPGAELQPRRAVAASLAAYHALTTNGDKERAQQWLHQGLRWSENPDADPDPYLHGIRALIALEGDGLAAMARAGEDAIDLARSAGADLALAYLLATHAVLTASTDAPTEVVPVAIAEEAVEIARLVGSPTMLELALGCLANVVHDTDPARAVALRDEGLAIDSGDIAQLQQTAGRILLALALDEDPVPFLDRALRHMQIERDLQTDVPLLAATAECAVRARRSDLAAEALGYIGSAGAAPWRRFGRTASSLASVAEHVADDLDDDQAARHRAIGATRPASSIVRGVRDAIAEP